MHANLESIPVSVLAAHALADILSGECLFPLECAKMLPGGFLEHIGREDMSSQLMGTAKNSTGYELQIGADHAQVDFFRDDRVWASYRITLKQLPRWTMPN